MRLIKAAALSEKIAEAFCEINLHQSRFVRKRLAEVAVENQLQQTVVETMLQNGKIAERDKMPLCQDTGSLLVFIELGENDCLGAGLREKLKDSVDKVTSECGLRFSIADKSIDSGRRLSNTPVVHIMKGAYKRTRVVIAAKGGGSENLSKLTMMNPSAGTSEITEFIIETIKGAGSKGCPPYIIGVGIGGNAETSLLSAKMALTGKFGHNRKRIEKAVSLGVFEGAKELKIGIHGLGFGPTILDCRTIYSPSHIATLPVGVAFNCFQERVKEFTV